MLYKQKLVRYFLLFSTGSLIICTILFSCLIINMQIANNNKLSQNNLSIASDMLDISGDYISAIMETFESSEALTCWVSTQNDSYYYYYPIQLRSEIQLANSTLNDFVFYLSFTTIAEEDFFISATSTVSKANFFSSTHTTLSRAEWDNALAYFENGGSTYVTAHYTDDVITELFCIFYNFGEIDGAVCLLSIDPQNLISSQITSPYYLIPTDTALAPLVSTLNEIDDATFAQDIALLNSALLETPEQSSFFVESDGKHILYVSTPSLPFAIAFPIEVTLLTQSNFVLIAFFPIALFLFFMLPISLFLSTTLYRPVSTILSDLLITDTPNRSFLNTTVAIDEFKIIQENTTSTSLLNQALVELQKEKFGIKKELYYRALLWGIPNEDCPLNATELELSYYVILIEYRLKENDSPNQDIELLYQKNLVKTKMHSCSTSCEVFYYNDVENALDSIICNEDGLACVITRLEEVVQESATRLDFFITRSNLVHRVTNIHHAFDEARKLTEYRYTLPSNKILTAGDIIKKSRDYYYLPLSIENQLITNIASGNKNALAIYDRVLRLNQFGKPFTSETRRDFVFVLVNTIQRVFQELKQTPEELLARPLDTQTLLDTWDAENIWSRIRLLINEILDALNQTTPKENNLHFIMQDFIASHYAEDIMLNDLANYCNLTPSYCSALFKSHFDGVTFKVYLNQYRIKTACTLLVTNPNIKLTELSTLVGFNSANSFIRAFNKEVGCPPKAYAEKKQQKASQ